MSTILQENPVTQTSDNDNNDDINHHYCCNPNIALCGKDITHEIELDYLVDNNCEMCSELLDTCECPGDGSDLCLGLLLGGLR